MKWLCVKNSWPSWTKQRKENSNPKKAAAAFEDVGDKISDVHILSDSMQLIYSQVDAYQEATQSLGSGVWKCVLVCVYVCTCGRVQVISK